MSQRVFVTGGSGFVGSAVLEELTKRQFHINALCAAAMRLLRAPTFG